MEGCAHNLGPFLVEVVALKHAPASVCDEISTLMSDFWARRRRFSIRHCLIHFVGGLFLPCEDRTITADSINLWGESTCAVSKYTMYKPFSRLLRNMHLLLRLCDQQNFSVGSRRVDVECTVLLSYHERWWWSIWGVEWLWASFVTYQEWLTKNLATKLYSEHHHGVRCRFYGDWRARILSQDD